MFNNSTRELSGATKVFAYIVGYIIGVGLGFGLNALFILVVCWGLREIGITSIGNWAVEFNWTLPLILTILKLINGIGKKIVNKNREDE